MSATGSTNVSNSWTWTESNTWTWDTVLQLITACLGTIGNLVVIIVLFPRRSVSSSTDTLIGSLAGADFLTSLLLLPWPIIAITVPPNWLGRFYCWTIFTNSHIWTCIDHVDASIYTLLTICLDRYVTVTYPLKYNVYVTRRRVLMVVSIIWMCSLANFAYGLVTDIDPSDNQCIIRFPSDFVKTCFGVGNFLVLYVIPVMTMLITQILTARTLLQQSHQWSNKGCPQPRPTFHLTARRKVLRMMSIVVAIFVVSLGPNQFAYFCYNLGVLPEWFYQGTFHRFTQVLASINSCANPFIYALQNRQFRQGIRNMWTRSGSGDSAIFDLI